MGWVWALGMLPARALACPNCGADAVREASVWWTVGCFLMVPGVLTAVVAVWLARVARDAATKTAVTEMVSGVSHG